MTSSRIAPWALLAARVLMGAFFLYEAVGPDREGLDRRRRAVGT